MRGAADLANYRVSAPLSNTERDLPSEIVLSSIGGVILQPKQQHISSTVQLALALRHKMGCSLPEFLAYRRSRRHRKHVQMVSNTMYS